MEAESVVVIPNRDGIEHLNECLESLRSQTYQEFQAVMVDDCSRDDSVKYVAEKYPEVDVLSLKDNLGFAGAVNEGIKYGVSEYGPGYVGVLNNDTRCDSNWLKSLVDRMKNQEKTAAVASNMLFYHNPEVINSQGISCRRRGDGYDINIYSKLSDAVDSGGRVLGVSFGACLLSTDAIGEVGLLDDRYYVYSEDLDWSIRANLMGYRIVYEEKAIVYHKLGGYFGGKNPHKSYLCMRNSLCTILKNYSFNNLVSVLPELAAYYMSYPFWSFREAVKEGGLDSVNWLLGEAANPIRSIAWNAANIRKTVEFRRIIQESRRVGDSELKAYMM